MSSPILNECNGLITSVGLNSGLPVKQLVIDSPKSRRSAISSRRAKLDMVARAEAEARALL
jgi:hypothetical protein